MNHLKKKSIYSKLNYARPVFVEKLRNLLDLITDNQLKYAEISEKCNINKDYNDVVECIDYVNYVGAPTSSDAKRMNSIWQKHIDLRNKYSENSCYFTDSSLY